MLEDCLPKYVHKWISVELINFTRKNMWAQELLNLHLIGSSKFKVWKRSWDFLEFRSEIDFFLASGTGIVVLNRCTLEEANY